MLHQVMYMYVHVKHNCIDIQKIYYADFCCLLNGSKHTSCEKYGWMKQLIFQHLWEMAWSC